MKKDRKNGSPGTAARRRTILLGQILFGVLLFGLGEFCSGRFFKEFWISRPSLIARRIYELALNGKLWYHLGATLQEIMIGLIAGMAIGVLLAILLAYSGVIQHWIGPYILALFSLPKASLAPLFVVWLGIGLASKVAMVILMVVFVVFYNIYEGIQNIDPDLDSMIRSFRGNWRKKLKWVIFPSLYSLVLNSLRISIGNATIGAVISEMVGSSHGMGYYSTYSSSILDTTGTFAGLFIIMAVALILGGFVSLIEKKILHKS